MCVGGVMEEVTSRELALRSAQALVNRALRVRAGEEVVIVADHSTKSIADLLTEAVLQANAEPVVIVMRRRTRAAEEPPEVVAAALSSAGAALLPTTYSLTHTKARNLASQRGVRILSLSQPSEATFISGVLDVDYEAIADQAGRFERLLIAASLVRVESGSGASLLVPIAGRKVTSSPGLCAAPGTVASPPCLEVNVGPQEDSTEGEIWVNGALVPAGTVMEPFLARFRHGVLQRPMNGADGAKWQSVLESFNDENVFRVVELGIGLNPKAQIGRGNNAENEGAAGAVHLGLGEGRTFGSRISASTHVDIVVCGASLWLDDQCVIHKGELLL